MLPDRNGATGVVERDGGKGHSPAGVGVREPEGSHADFYGVDAPLCIGFFEALPYMRCSGQWMFSEEVFMAVGYT